MSYKIRAKNYDPAPEYQADAYAVRGWSGVAFGVLGWETEPDSDTEWSGYENQTGNLIVVMVGDDRLYSVSPTAVSEIAQDAYCHECGQIGCKHGSALSKDELS